MNPAHQEVATCALCGGANRRILFREDPFRVVRCTSCGLVYTTPRLAPEALFDQVYNENYWASDSPKEKGYAAYAAEERFYLRTFRRRWAFVRRHAPRPGRLLDLGCAAGFFMTVAGERGWKTTGLEPSRPIAELAVRRLPDATVHIGRIEEAPFQPGMFDLVTLWDVIEHTPDPADFIRRAADLVAPGGVLMLETQNVESLFARALGRRWQHYKHEEHLFHFGPSTLRRLLEREAGLEVLEMTGRWGGKYVSPAFIAERAGRLHPLLSTLLKPASCLRNLGLYINLYDELLVACRRGVGGEPR